MPEPPSEVGGHNPPAHQRLDEAEGTFGSNPPAEPRATVFIATGISGAFGLRAAAAALACAGADGARASLFVDVGGRLPRSTLMATAAARSLEERLAATLPMHSPAARGQVCHLAVRPDAAELAAVVDAVSDASVEVAVLNLPADRWEIAPTFLEGIRISGAMVRADLPAHRSQLVPLVRELIGTGLRVGVLKQRLGWQSERRAMFGLPPVNGVGGLPDALLGRLLGDPVRAHGADRFSTLEAANA